MIRSGVEIRVPGDKSVSHRAVLFGGMARGVTRIRGLLHAEDVGRTVAAVEALGCGLSAEFSDDPVCLVRGADWGDAGGVDCGNSGTTARLLLGALTARAGASLHGDASLSRRPMMRVITPLRAMGADIEGGPTLPVRVRAAKLRGIEQVASVASAQVKSAVLLAGLGADGPTRYVEPVATRDHTERMLLGMGARLRTRVDPRGTVIEVEPGSLEGIEVEVPGDISSAAFWMVAAAIHPGASVVLRDVGLNPTRTGVIDVLRRMGARVEVEERGGVEPIGDVRVTGQGLRGVSIGGPEHPGEIPRLVDELPVLAIAAAFADGETVVADAAELRVKESDRVQSVVDGLRRLGVSADARPDGFVVRGGGARSADGPVETHGDHRIAMAFSIASSRVECAVSETDSIATSYPGFLGTLACLRGEREPGWGSGVREIR